MDEFKAGSKLRKLKVRGSFTQNFWDGKFFFGLCLQSLLLFWYSILSSPKEKFNLLYSSDGEDIAGK